MRDHANNTLNWSVQIEIARGAGNFPRLMRFRPRIRGCRRAALAALGTRGMNG